MKNIFNSNNSQIKIINTKSNVILNKINLPLISKDVLHLEDVGHLKSYIVKSFCAFYHSKIFSNVLFRYIILLLFITKSISLSQEYESNKLVIKVTNEYYQQNVNLNNFKDGIKSFEQILGKHKVQHFVDERILTTLKKRKSQDNLLSNQKNNSLERILLIEYDGKIDALYASKKLNSQEFIEYAEPMYIRKIFDLETPNDELYSSQYYLNSIYARESWSLVDTNQKQVIMGIVDTGVDYLHEDLEGNIYINPGEDGIDENGNDKRTNGIDDDGNGFIDDYMGWDFGSEDGDDNDPMAGHGHGTHVAGIISATKNNMIGIAGIGLNTKILPVKISGNSPNSRTLTNSYSGVLYAALLGADIINCSWGGGGFAQAEMDIIDEVVSMGTSIVAAAGNDYSNVRFYPASYNGILSVAAIDSNDIKAPFSNYNASVDVSAPGVKIISTTPNNNYDSWDGTSMASPVAAAVASMVKHNFPDYNAIQVIEHVKATTEDINWLNTNYQGTIGSGKVNALHASTELHPISISLKNFTVHQEIEDEVIRAGERIDISLEVFNALQAVKDVKIYAFSTSPFVPVFINDELSAGDMDTYETKSVEGTISLIVPEEASLNYSLPILLTFVDDEGHKFRESINIFVNPSWRTMKKNNIGLTFTSQGNLAYDDFPNNNQGEGFTYRKGHDILFEGSLMVAYGSKRLSNVARGSSGSAKNRDFIIVQAIENYSPGNIADEETYTEYSTRTDDDSLEDTTLAHAGVIQTGYQFLDNDRKNFIIVNYDIINNSSEFQDSVFVALYMDWDIGPSGSDNIAIWNENKEYGYVYNDTLTEYPYAGFKLLSEQRVNFWAIDNDGDSEDNPGVYDGFTKEEKYRTMSSGIGRPKSNSTDCSAVFGAGPMRLRPNDTTRVSIAFFAGNNLQELDNVVDFELPKIEGLINPNGDFNSFVRDTRIKLIYPNPSADNIAIQVSVNDISKGEISIWDMMGKKIATIYEYNSKKDEKIYPGFLQFTYDVSGLSQGQYFVKFTHNRGVDSQIFKIVR